MRKKAVAVKPTERQAILEERRRLKMARSAHAYVRGNTLQFYEWLKAGSGDKLPQGPPIWICGDCHVGNLGPVANADGKVEIEIRDLDQTVIGNPAHDLIRLGLSLATAARGSDHNPPGLGSDLLRRAASDHPGGGAHVGTRADRRGPDRRGAPARGGQP